MCAFLGSPVLYIVTYFLFYLIIIGLLSNSITSLDTDLDSFILQTTSLLRTLQCRLVLFPEHQYGSFAVLWRQSTQPRLMCGWCTWIVSQAGDHDATRMRDQWHLNFLCFSVYITLRTYKQHFIRKHLNAGKILTLYVLLWSKSLNKFVTSYLMSIYWYPSKAVLRTVPLHYFFFS